VSAGRFVAPLGRAFDHSLTGRACRRVFDGSILAGAAVATVRGLFEMRRRLGVGFADPASTAQRRLAAERMAMLFDRSLIVRTLERYAGAIAEGGRRSLAARMLLGPLRVADHGMAVRTAGAMLLWAVAAHAATFAVLGVPLTVRGGTARLVVVVLGAAMVAGPTVFARGWSGSAARRSFARATGSSDPRADDHARD
jgi:hypothetical protein